MTKKYISDHTTSIAKPLTDYVTHTETIPVPKIIEVGTPSLVTDHVMDKKEGDPEEVASVKKKKKPTKTRININIGIETNKKVNKMLKEYGHILPNKSVLIDALLSEYVDTFYLSTRFRILTKRNKDLLNTIRVKFDY